MSEDTASKLTWQLRGEWKWWASYDGGERYSVGPADSREAIIEEVMDEGLGEYETDDGQWRLQATIAECRKDGTDLAAWFDFESWLEDTSISMEENGRGGDEDGEYHPLSELKDGQVRDLEASIKAAIRDWQQRHGLTLEPWCFAEVRNREEIDVPHPNDEETTA